MGRFVMELRYVIQMYSRILLGSRIVVDADGHKKLLDDDALTHWRCDVYLPAAMFGVLWTLVLLARRGAVPMAVPTRSFLPCCRVHRFLSSKGPRGPSSANIACE